MKCPGFIRAFERTTQGTTSEQNKEESEMLKNGRPYSIENGYEDAALITDKPEEIQEIVFAWIHENLMPRKTILHGRTSYGIKHILEHDTKIYLTNNEFKDAMLQCGYEPVDPNMLNWVYCLSKRSPAFQWKRS